jgi:acetyl-CoA carboxylase carboxyltransferase component
MSTASPTPSPAAPTPSQNPAAKPVAAAAPQGLRELTDLYAKLESKIRLGGGQKAIDRQHEKGRLTARERVERLIDKPEQAGAAKRDAAAVNVHAAEMPGFQELGLWSAWGMYEEHGGAPAAGVVTGVGRVQGRQCMIIANDATVKAGAFFPMTCKKIIRAQMIAQMARLPLIYLVDSAGVFLPLQEDVFPDTDDFGRIFRNNAVISAEGIPQIAAIMGYCVAGGGYLPVLCDTLLMTEGSGLYLAGPALVKAAIGQVVTDEELGGATMHAEISGTIDFKEKDDESCIWRLRELMGKYGEGSKGAREQGIERRRIAPPYHGGEKQYDFFTDKPGAQYEVRDLIAAVVDSRNDNGTLAPDFDEYKADYGPSIVCGYANLGGLACGIVANQKMVTRTGAGAVQLPGVIYHDSADKAARFIMDCNQRKIPLVFLHDTTGFMVGKESEQHGIIRAGAKMVNAMSNCIVPKIVVIVGGSYGAGNYAMCGRGFDPFVTLAWPSGKCAVMGANQATGVLTTIEEASRKRKGETIDEETHKAIYAAVHASYTEQADIRHGAARGWLDRIIQPHRTREELIGVLQMTENWDYSREFRTGVLQT